MSQLERIYKLDRLLRRKQPPTKREILQYFEISPAQFKRDLDFMRDRLGASITFDAGSGGYRYSSGEFNLPGLWFSEPEVYSMLLMHALLDQLQHGILREQLEPFEEKLRSYWERRVRGRTAFWTGCRSRHPRSAQPIQNTFRPFATVLCDARSSACAITLVPVAEKTNG